MKRQTLLKQFPKFISAFGASVLSLSVVYDYGFFKILGTSFSEIPTTLSDHLRSSLTWIPETTTTFFAVFILELFIRRVEQGMTEEELIQSSSAPKFITWFRRSPKYLVTVFVLTSAFALFQNIDLPIQAWQLSAVFAWLMLHSFLFGHERIRQRTSEEFRIGMRWIPAVLIFFAFNGAIAAEKIRGGDGTQYVFDLEETKIVGTLVRTFEKHYLIWDKEQIKLLSASKVAQFYPAPIAEEKIRQLTTKNWDPHE